MITRNKTISYFQDSHYDVTGGKIMVAMCNGHYTLKKVWTMVRSGALTETFCEECSSQYRLRPTQLSP